MNSAELAFERPTALQAVGPRTDPVRLLVTMPQGHIHAGFADLAEFFKPGDLIVVNQSATIPASLPAVGPTGPFLANLSTRYGPTLWLIEPRHSHAEPGPLPLEGGDRVWIAGVPGRLVRAYPGLDRLWFVRLEAPIDEQIQEVGTPIRYGYVEAEQALSAYQTLFSLVPGSSEMPSAGRPLTAELVAELLENGVRFAPIVLHTGVSSLEIETERVGDQPLYPEPFIVPASTARIVNQTRRRGDRVIAVGTTAVRALETAWTGSGLRPAEGFTRLFIQPGRGVHAIDGLITGFHDPLTTHLAMLYAIVGRDRIQEAYTEAVRRHYLWHEFGDSHLILR